MSRIALLTTPKTMKQNGYPLGLMYLASTLRTWGGHDVTIIDTKVNNMPIDTAVKKAGDFAADIIAISGMTYEAFEVHQMAKRFKKTFPQKTVIVGGPHPTCAPEQAVRDPNVDFVVVGEGEEAVTSLVGALESGESFHEIPGIAFRTNGETIIVPRKVPKRELDDIPFPAWDLIDVDQYINFTRQSVIYAHPRFMTIFTSRGCPYQCIYCHPVFGKKWRKRSPENILKEITTLYEQYGIREFHIADDNFNLELARAERVCDLIVESGMKIHLSFPNGLRADILTPQLLQKLKAAGAFMISYAIESATPRIQKFLKKNVNFDKTTLTINETDRQGILSNGFFMIGFPDETKEEIQSTLDFAWKSKFHTASFFVVNPFPGTELFELVKDKLPHQLTDITQKEYNYFSANYGISDLKDTVLQKFLRSANIKFYFNPRRMLRTLQLIPRKSIIPRLIIRFIQRTFFKG